MRRCGPRESRRSLITPGGAAIILIRGTQRLLRRIGRQSINLGASTNALGDWYATLVYAGRTQLVLCTSANSLLSVVFEAKQARMRIREHLCSGLEYLLFDIGVAESQVRAELSEMGECRFGPTVSRSILGSMNDFTSTIRYMIGAQPDIALRRVNLALSETPCRGILGMGFPNERARMLLENWHRECNPTRQ